jgi:hypothetical protein
LPAFPKFQNFGKGYRLNTAIHQLVQSFGTLDKFVRDRKILFIQTSLSFSDKPVADEIG